MTRHLSRLGGLLGGLAFASVAPAQVSGLFSVENSFTATAGPHAGAQVSQGDLLSTRGRIVRTNLQLTNAFCQEPIAPDVGLDALHILPNGDVLFSVEESFYSECQSRQISEGDLLSPDGTVVRTNAQLMANFHPQPPAPDVGLDAVHVQTSGEILFSSEIDFFDEQMGVLLTHGDILSDQGRIVRTNRELMANFHPQPPIVNMGLDVIVARPDGEFWWSPETGWFDEQLGVSIGDGDLLSTNGSIVATESQLLTAFLGAEVPPGIGLDAFALPAAFATCGTLEPGPQGCTLFRPDGSAQAYFIENTEGPGPGERVFVSGEFNLYSTLCTPLVGPGIENNVIGLCFEGCGTIEGGPQGCPIFRVERQTSIFYFIENIGEFNFGDYVFVRGILNNESTLCLPPGGPGIEHNTILECFWGCGQLVPGPQGCTQLLPDDSTTALFIENTEGFELGDHVFVQGPINPQSHVCGPFTAPAIEDNSIAACFEGCGTLVRGVECVFFQPDISPEFFRLDNYADFVVGDRVFVRGGLVRLCFTPCLQGDGCIYSNTITSCCPCDWNADAVLNSQDFFDFLTDFFAGNADFNGDMITNSQDFFDFLTCFFNGCG